MNYIDISDEDGTPYITIKRKRLNGRGYDTWVVGHTNEPFRVTLAVPTKMLVVHAGTWIRAVLYVDGTRIRDTRVPLPTDMDEGEIICTWGDSTVSPTLAFGCVSTKRCAPGYNTSKKDGTISCVIHDGITMSEVWSVCIYYNAAISLESRGILTPDIVKEHQKFFPARTYKKITPQGSQWEWIQASKSTHNWSRARPCPRDESTHKHSSRSKVCPAFKSSTSSGSKISGGTASLGFGTEHTTTPITESRARPLRRIVLIPGRRACSARKRSPSSRSKAIT